ncbi:InlB B-repeat-containing protein [Bacteroides fragilis]|uniref:InlB B-repeat-containing protein n=1 Tax=Bacteroides fragilis TaxID=817 RepID=UPI002030B2D6|nr:hypothetical protein [Bacteroides fragilis]
MKKVRFLLLATLVAMFTSCQKEVVEQGAGDNRPTPTGDTRITIEGEGMIGPATRSSDGKVEFEGGYATGAGLYSGDAKPTVAAYPNPGYEVNYFYGGPENEPQKYDYAQSGSSTFTVPLGGQDHRFRCGFKEKKRELTVNAGTGGSVSPSGTNSYRVEKPISITATPNSGYEFAGWAVTEGDATIENPGSPSTTVTLHKSGSTITANFKSAISVSDYIFVGDNGLIYSKGTRYKVGNVSWRSIAYGNGKYVVAGYDVDQGYITTSTDGTTWTTPQKVGDSQWFAIAYGNGQFVIVGRKYISSSTDGSTWVTPHVIGGEDDLWYDITYGNGKFVTVGYKGIAGSSANGVNWNYNTIYGNGGVTNWYSITYGDGKFVAGGLNGAISTSTNGDNWHLESGDTGSMWTPDAWRGIAYGNGIYIAADGNFKGYSPDAKKWTFHVNGMTTYTSCVRFIKGLFIATGSGISGPAISASADGDKWTTVLELKGESVQDVCGVQ